MAITKKKVISTAKKVLPFVGTAVNFSTPQGAFNTSTGMATRYVADKLKKNTFNPKMQSPLTDPNMPSLLSDYSGVVNNLVGSGSSSGSGGGGASGINLKPMIDSYNQGANAQKDVITNESKTKRQSLLDTIIRLQEDTAKGREAQQKTYNSARGSIEDNAFMSSRATRASKAAKGMGGSGLEDLALLKGSIEAGNNISGIANENIDKQGALTTNLTRGTEDANNSIQAAITEEALKLRGVDADTAEKIATLQYNEKQRVAAIRASSSGSSSSADAARKLEENSVKDAQIQAKSAVNEFVNQFSSAKSTKAKTALKTSAISGLNTLSGQLGVYLPENDVKLLTKYIKNYK